METLDFITGLMRENYEALGFIPSPTVEQRYIANGQFILQCRAGLPVGYILHGKAIPGGLLHVSQHVIEYDLRQRGYGMDAINQLIERAQIANCRAIVLRCAADLPSNAFWQAAGFELTKTEWPKNKRKRAKHTYVMDLWPRLFMAG